MALWRIATIPPETPIKRMVKKLRSAQQILCQMNVLFENDKIQASPPEALSVAEETRTCVAKVLISTGQKTASAWSRLYSAVQSSSETLVLALTTRNGEGPILELGSTFGRALLRYRHIAQVNIHPCSHLRPPNFMLPALTSTPT